MSIDFDKFLNWAESRFDDIQVSGNEIKLNSIFAEDRKHHLWCNPSGGKTGHSQGVYHCWKSGNKGNLPGLVMLVDKCTYEEAVETLGSLPEGSLFDLERRVEELFKKDEVQEEAKEFIGIPLPPDCYPLDELPSFNWAKKSAEEYLAARKIPPEGLMVGTRGRYRNRIIIPYLDRQGSLIYYNGRYIGDQGDNLRYLGPPKELGVGKSDVLFVPSWPAEGEKIHITEGEFDAMSLNQCGLKSAALGGKSISEKQINMLKGLRVVLCLDADEAGGEALPKIAASMLARGFSSISYVRPCKEYKDWNGMLVEKGEKILKEYVKTQESPYNESSAIGDWEATRMAMKRII